MLVRLAEILPPHVRVRIIADRGFGDHKLDRLLTEQLHFDYVIRFRGNIAGTAASGETRSAAAWVPPPGSDPADERGRCPARRLPRRAIGWAASSACAMRT